MSARPVIGDVVPLGQTSTGAYTALAATLPVQASGVLTSNNTNVSNGDTVTIAGPNASFTYIFVDALSANYVAGQVLKGTSADDSLTNLGYAVNNTSAQAGIKFNGRAANPYVTASAVSAHAVTFTAINTSNEWLGANGNIISTSTTASTLSWGAATLANGSAGVLEVSGPSGGGIPVTPSGASNLTTSQVATSTTAGIAAIARSTRRSVLIGNLDASITVYVGPATVTSGNGYPLLPGQSCPFTFVGLIQVIAASGTPTIAVADEY